MNASDDRSAHAVTAQLVALAEDLGRRGFAANVTQAKGHVCLSVVNGSVSAFTGPIFATLDEEDGSWWFWWPRTGRIALISEVETAGFKIADVLTPHMGDGCEPYREELAPSERTVYPAASIERPALGEDALSAQTPDAEAQNEAGKKH